MVTPRRPLGRGPAGYGRLARQSAAGSTAQGRGRALELGPRQERTIVAALDAGARLLGVLGMILAVPLTAFLVAFWRLAREKYIEELV